MSNHKPKYDCYFQDKNGNEIIVVAHYTYYYEYATYEQPSYEEHEVEVVGVVGVEPENANIDWITDDMIIDYILTHHSVEDEADYRDYDDIEDVYI